jgi:hypothetical protein
MNAKACLSMCMAGSVLPPVRGQQSAACRHGTVLLENCMLHKWCRRRLGMCTACTDSGSYLMIQHHHKYTLATVHVVGCQRRSCCVCMVLVTHSAGHWQEMLWLRLAAAALQGLMPGVLSATRAQWARRSLRDCIVHIKTDK